MNFHRILKEYLRDFDLEMIVLVETIVSGAQADDVVRKVSFPNSHRIEAKGFSREFGFFGRTAWRWRLSLINFNLFI